MVQGRPEVKCSGSSSPFFILNLFNFLKSNRIIGTNLCRSIGIHTEVFAHHCGIFNINERRTVSFINEYTSSSCLGRFIVQSAQSLRHCSMSSR